MQQYCPEIRFAITIHHHEKIHHPTPSELRPQNTGAFTVFYSGFYFVGRTYLPTRPLKK
jgi:hypothetical protein